MKHIDGKVVKTGDKKPDLGCEEKYLPVCWKCWNGKKTYIQEKQKNNVFNKEEWMIPLYNEIEKNIYDSKSRSETLDKVLFPSIKDDETYLHGVTKDQLDYELDE